MTKRLKAAIRAFKQPQIVEYWDATENERFVKYWEAMKLGIQKNGESFSEAITRIYQTERDEL